MKIEFVLFWIAVGLYCLSACSYIFGLISKHDKPFTAGLYSALAGFVPHVLSIALRWMDTGVSPFITISESLSFGVFCAVLTFLVLEFTSEKVRPLGVLILPIAFILMGWGGSIAKGAATQLVPALQSGWIWAHIIGAASGFGAVLTAAGLPTPSATWMGPPRRRLCR